MRRLRSIALAVAAVALTTAPLSASGPSPFDRLQQIPREGSEETAPVPGMPTRMGPVEIMTPGGPFLAPQPRAIEGIRIGPEPIEIAPPQPRDIGENPPAEAAIETESNDGNDNGDRPECVNARKQKKVHRGEGYCDGDGDFVPYARDKKNDNKNAAAPSLSIEAARNDPNATDKVTMTLKAHDDDGIERIWWWVVGDEFFTGTVEGGGGPYYIKVCDGQVDCQEDWNLRLSGPLGVTINAQSRDKKGKDSEVIQAIIRMRG